MLRGAAMCVVLLAQINVAYAGSSIPSDSHEKLGVVFGGVRDRLWEVNDRFWHEGDFERCIATLRLITEIDPYDTEAFSNGSWLMWNEGRNDQAEAFLLKGLTVNRNVNNLYFDLGYFYYNAERFPEAVDCLETAIAIKSEIRLWHLLAHANEHAGNPTEALNIWLLMEAYEPDPVVPRMQIDRILSGEPPPPVHFPKAEEI